MKWLLALAVAAVAGGGTAQGEEQKPEVSFEDRLLATIPSGLAPGEIVFAPDGRGVAYWAQDGDKHTVVVGEERSEAYEGDSGIAFSPDGKTVAYGARMGNKAFVVMGGAKGEEFDAVQNPVFSPDGTVAYAAKKGDKVFFVIGEKKGEEFDDLAGRPLAFSPDGKVVAYGARKGGEWFVVVGGKRGDAFDRVSNPVFSPDGQVVAYAAKKGSKWFLVVGDKRGEETGFALRDLIFSPDGQFLYFVEVDKSGCLVARRSLSEDGVDLIANYGSVGAPVISPDGSLIAYAASNGGNWFLVVRRHAGPDQNGERLDEVYSPVFGPDGTKVAYGARKGRELWWKVMSVK